MIIIPLFSGNHCTPVKSAKKVTLNKFTNFSKSHDQEKFLTIISKIYVICLDFEIA